MDCHGNEAVAALTEPHANDDRDSISPTASYPSTRSETESVSTSQVPCHQPRVTEIQAPEAYQAATQAVLYPNEAASSSESGVDASPQTPELSTPTTKHHPTWSLSYSLGRSNSGIMIGGIIASCATIGFLIFLWTGQGPTSDGQYASHAWRSLMLSGRLPQLVTLSSVLLRFSIGAQTTICTSLVAALILERRSIALSRVAPLSIFRSVNSGPRILIQQILGEKHSRYLLLHPEVLLLIVLALGNIAMQFSSTILFSDLQSRLLVKFSQKTQTGLLQSNNSVAFFVEWANPPRFSLFGEPYTGYSANPNSLGLSDTGVKRHVMIPFADSEGRTALRSYRGPSLVLSSRVACMPPVVSSEVRFTNVTLSGSPLDQNYGYMTGRVIHKETFSGAGILDTCDSDECLSDDISFDCSVPMNYRGFTDAEPIVHTFSTVVLVFRTNFNYDDWESLGNKTMQLPQSKLQEEWRGFDFGLDRIINMTVCFKSMNVMLSNVSLSTEKDLAEPGIGYNGTIADTDNIRLFYGSQQNAQNSSERGIFTVEEIHDRDDFVYGATDHGQFPLYEETTSTIEYFGEYTKPNTTLPGCISCACDTIACAREYSKVFSDSILATRRASVAIQTIYTMLVQSIHDQFIGYFSILLPVETVETAFVTVPTRCVGLGSVAALVVVNLACILMITALYLLHSRYTLVDNFWHVISQTVSDATAQTLDHSNRSKDKDIFDRLKTGDYPVQLQNLVDTGEIKIAKANSNSDVPSVIRWYRRGLQALHGK
ncbi:hypothetical protein GGR55DRAFT_696070 [Xylaria sp. FL0064]|nr:hypothetical protein GGR55DRAFT_696070 [Xylaria sp. FL0064]